MLDFLLLTAGDSPGFRLGRRNTGTRPVRLIECSTHMRRST